MQKNLIYLCSFLLFLSGVHSYSQIKVLSYNLLNFPTGNLQGRVDTLRNIIDYTRPNLLMVQELETAEGLQSITDMMNEIGYGDFAHPEFIPQQSPGSPSNQLQQSIVFDTEIFRLKSDGVVLTDYRDINEYVLYLNDPALANGSDTTFLFVYVTHLKSSTGTDNEQMRLSMVNYLITHFETLPANSHVLFAGDFNLYNNLEPAYLAMMDESNAIVMHDIYTSYGNWAGSAFEHKEILTQCTRSSVIFNDGAGGGVDDRFDFILMSESLMNQSSEFAYTENSYKSVGNTGGCYNQSITDCSSGNEVPPHILQSMYFMSDHIPQYCEFHSDLIDHVAEINFKQPELLIRNSNQQSQQISYTLSGLAGLNYSLDVIDINGKVIHHQEQMSTLSGVIDVSPFPQGMYLLRVISDSEKILPKKFTVVR